MVNSRIRTLEKDLATHVKKNRNKQRTKIILNIVLNKREWYKKNPLSMMTRNPCSSNFKPSITSTKENENRTKINLWTTRNNPELE